MSSPLPDVIEYPVWDHDHDAFLCALDTWLEYHNEETRAHDVIRCMKEMFDEVDKLHHGFVYLRRWLELQDFEHKENELAQLDRDWIIHVGGVACLDVPDEQMTRYDREKKALGDELCEKWGVAELEDIFISEVAPRVWSRNLLEALKQLSDIEHDYTTCITKVVAAMRSRCTEESLPIIKQQDVKKVLQTYRLQAEAPPGRRSSRRLAEKRGALEDEDEGEDANRDEDADADADVDADGSYGSRPSRAATRKKQKTKAAKAASKARSTARSKLPAAAAIRPGSVENEEEEGDSDATASRQALQELQDDMDTLGFDDSPGESTLLAAFMPARVQHLKNALAELKKAGLIESVPSLRQGLYDAVNQLNDEMDNMGI